MKGKKSVKKRKAVSPTSVESYQYLVFNHQNAFASPDAMVGTVQLGGYFQNNVHLTTALDAWGKDGWFIPNIAVAWEQFKSSDNQEHVGFRIRNAGAPVLAGEGGVSAVVAARKVTAK